MRGSLQGTIADWKLQAKGHQAGSGRCAADRGAFDIDANGIVQVSAKDLGTGKHQEITITASSKFV